METFAQIYQRAAERKLGKKGLAELMPHTLSAKQLAKLPDHVFLAEMTKKIFQSGFVWRVVEKKWPGFEQVFWEFDPYKLQFASDEQIEKMAQDTRIIRNFIKVKSVRQNALFVQEISEKEGSFGEFIANWPSEQITQLWLYLKKHGSRLGGNTGPYFLRTVGKDTFLLTRDVVQYLIAQNLISKHPTSQRDLKLVQNAFNQWHQESGLSFADISRTIACSVGENHLE